MAKIKTSCCICGCQCICIVKRQIYDVIKKHDYLFIERDENEEEDEISSEVLDTIFEIIAKSCSCFVQDKEED